MKCPHCLEHFHDDKSVQQLGTDSTSNWTLWQRTCPACGKFILSLFERTDLSGDTYYKKRELLCYPKTISRAAVSADVPEKFAVDYREACTTLPDSAKASAALSRRCLQHVLREKANIKPGNLANEIQQVIDGKQLPSHLSESLDVIRNIGNFAAHPIKSTSTGEIIEVEPGEAEWNLDVLESLFDYYFVQPAILYRKRDALNKKLADAGKPGMK